jgi:hypothetical protein
MTPGERLAPRDAVLGIWAGPWCSPKKAAIAAMSQMSSSSKPWDFSTSKSGSPTVSAERETFECEVEHGLLALCDVGLSVVDCHLVRDQRVLCSDPEDRPVGDDAILALV